MAAEDYVSTALNNAKKTLQDVSKSNVSPVKSQYAPKPETPYNATYSVAREARKSGGSSGLAEEAHSAGEGIAARMKNEAEAKASLQKQ